MIQSLLSESHPTDSAAHNAVTTLLQHALQ